MHDSDRKAGFLAFKTVCGIVRYVLLWVVSLFLALNYFHHYLATSDPPSKPGKYHIVDAVGVMLCDLKLDSARLALTSLFVQTEAPAQKSGAAAADGAPGKQTPPAKTEAYASGKGAAPAVAVSQAAPATPPASTLRAPLDVVLNEIHGLHEVIKKRTHPPQSLPDSLLKVLVVMAISWLWFQTFLLANDLKRDIDRWRNHRAPFNTARFRSVEQQTQADCFSPTAVPPARAPRWRDRKCFDHVPLALKWILGIWSLGPPLLFAIAMHSVYEPAVFVMALAAIFVAAEHYGGLTETEHELRHRTDELKAKMGRVLDADGLSEWRSEVWGLYGKASYRVDAVIREFDIDQAWWKCAGAPDPWKEYLARCAGSYGADTLLSTLTRTEANVRFVTDQRLEALVRLPQAPRRTARPSFVTCWD